MSDNPTTNMYDMGREHGKSEKTKGRAKIGLALFAVFFLAFGALIGSRLNSREPAVSVDASSLVEEPRFYILRSEAYPSIDGGVNLVLDYAREGVVQAQAVFDTTEQRDAYIKHLETLGRVLNKRSLE